MWKTATRQVEMTDSQEYIRDRHRSTVLRHGHQDIMEVMPASFSHSAIQNGTPMYGQARSHTSTTVTCGYSESSLHARPCAARWLFSATSTESENNSISLCMTTCQQRLIIRQKNPRPIGLGFIFYRWAEITQLRSHT